MVTCSAPMRPAIFVPLNTRPGKEQAPIEPGARCILWLPWLAPWPVKLWRFMAPAKPLPRLTAVTSTRSPLARHVGLDLLADLVAVDGVEAQLDQAHARLDAGLGEVPGLGLVQLAGVLAAVGDLDGGVAVALGGLDLHDPQRARP